MLFVELVTFPVDLVEDESLLVIVCQNTNCKLFTISFEFVQ